VEDSSDDSEQEDDSPPPPIHPLTDDELNTMRSHPYPSDDEDYPAYWPAYEQPSPPRPNSPAPCDITIDQLIQWTTTQFEWHTFRRRIPELSETPDELCGAPPIHRDMPNREFMWQYEGSNPDTIDVNNRILGYLQSRLSSWTSYLRTLPPIVRRHYPPPQLPSQPTHNRKRKTQDPDHPATAMTTRDYFQTPA
jgi:hypothetical protein